MLYFRRDRTWETADGAPVTTMVLGQVDLRLGHPPFGE